MSGYKHIERMVREFGIGSHFKRVLFNLMNILVLSGRLHSCYSRENSLNRNRFVDNFTVLGELSISLSFLNRGEDITHLTTLDEAHRSDTTLDTADLADNTMLAVANLGDNTTLDTANLADNTTLSVANLADNTMLAVANLADNTTLAVPNLAVNRLLDTSDPTDITTLTNNIHSENNLCSDHCRSDNQDNLPSLETCENSMFKCFPCKCTLDCAFYGTCCPSIDHQDNHGHTSATVTKCDDTSVEGLSFLYIRSCSRHFSDLYVMQMCVDDIPAHEQTIETFVRANDNTTRVVYYNKFCAVCNGVAQPAMWDVTISCEHYLGVYTARTRDELLRLSLHDDSTCQVIQNVSKTALPYTCPTRWFGQPIDSCNVTGNWSTFDEDVASLCENNTDQADVTARISVKNPDMYYTNIFCALCNSEPSLTARYRALVDGSGEICPPAGINFVDPDKPEPRRVLPFSLLLGSVWNNENVEQRDDWGLKFGNCSSVQWASPDSHCLAMECTPGKYLADGECTTAIDSIRGLGYSAQIVYIQQQTFLNETIIDTPSHNRSNCSWAIDNLVKHYQQTSILDPSFVETKLTVYCVKNIDNCDETNRHKSCTVSRARNNAQPYKLTLPSLTDHADFFLYSKIFVVANGSMHRDDFEKYLLTTLQLNMTELLDGGTSSTSLSPLLVTDVPDFVTCFNTNLGIESQNTNVQIKTLDIIRKRQIEWVYVDMFLTLQPTLTCVYISFNQSEYSLHANCTTFPPDWHISLNLGQVTLTFSDVSDLNRLAVIGGNGSTDGQLKVCVDLLEEKVQELKDRPRLWRYEDSAIYLWLYYLTQVCIGLSMICLLVTLLTFALFPPLRNNAGTNNMFLSGTILLAQASLLSSVHVDGPSWLCTTLGISTHFLWLSVTYWSFICCLHMFRVFTSKTGVTQSSAASQKISLIKKVLASILTPTVVIATVMVSSFLTSGGQRIGYTDRNPCYLDSSLVTLLSLVAPLGIVCVVNCCFFATTVYKIHQVTTLQSNSGARLGELRTFTIYIKLSTLTGSFWIIAIISEATNFQPLRFVAIILNGLQGMFLFLSFVCNKRVIRTCLPSRLNQTMSSLATVPSSAGDSQREETNFSLPHS